MDCQPTSLPNVGEKFARYGRIAYFCLLKKIKAHMKIMTKNNWCTFLLLSVLLMTESVAAMGQNVKGRIVCNGKGVAHVAVSDGDSTVLTDRNGYYSLQSDKRNGYVFYTLPRGYEPEVADGFRPRFWAALGSSDKSVTEIRDFRLVRRKGSANYVMIIGADTHLADRARDVEQFRGFTSALDRERENAGKSMIHSLLLGDLSWDNYWFANRYALPDFLNTCREQRYSMTMWPVMGNHDNDPSVSDGEATDFLCSGPWRRLMAPNYYSFNLGKVHYVVLDDIYYKNEREEGAKYKTGVAGSRNYDGLVTDEQLRWLEKDLSLVADKSCPLVIALHIPVWKLDLRTYAAKANLKNGTSERLCAMFKDFKEVHIVSGHTHINYTAHPEAFPNVTEHNIAAVCATWWNTGFLTGKHICKDGAPGGYSVWQVKGKKLKWTYRAMTGSNVDRQMRIYDMNTVKRRYETDASLRRMLQRYTKRTDYATYDDNVVLVNVYSYDTDWKIQITEGGKPLEAERVTGEDPYHTLAYDYAQFTAKGKYGEGSATGRTGHLFRAKTRTAILPVTVKVTDGFGRTYVGSISRPHPYDLDMEGRQRDGVLN